jgi:broad specificity phosphatase PhoE
MRRYVDDPQHVDAPLSAEGEAQATRAAAAVAGWRHKPTLVVSSPLTRALQTASIVFEKELEAGALRAALGLVARLPILSTSSTDSLVGQPQADAAASLQRVVQGG